jgi:cold shock CspA family protein
MRQRGQVLSFDATKQFGIIISVNGERQFFSGHDLSEPVGQNDWVEFSSKPNIMSARSRIDWVAEDVRRIEFSTNDLIHGTVVRWNPDRLFGFIDYEVDGQLQSALFHVRDLLKADGIEPVPVVGCTVSFFIIQRTKGPLGVQVWIEEWPESEPSFEEQFAAAEELPTDIPAPVVSQPSSVLSARTKGLTLIEIMRIRREGICSTVARKR